MFIKLTKKQSENLIKVFNLMTLFTLDKLCQKWFDLTVENGKVTNFKVKIKEERQCI